MTPEEIIEIFKAPAGYLGPIGLEGLDDRLILDNVAKGLNAEGRELLPRIDEQLGGAYLLVEMGGATQAEADDAATRAMRTPLRFSFSA